MQNSTTGARPAVATTWREPLVRGVLAIVMGIVLIALPVTAAYVFAIAFGVYVLFDGVVAIVHAVRNAHPEAGRWWAMILRGILGVVVGGFAVLFPSAAAAALGTVIALYAIVAGALEISSAFRVRHDVPRETTLIALGALTMVAGAILLLMPLIALVAQIYIVAAYAIVAGIGLIAYALRLRKRAEVSAAPATAVV